MSSSRPATSSACAPARATSSIRSSGGSPASASPIAHPTLSGLSRPSDAAGRRTEERRVGKGSVSTCRSGGSAEHYKKKHIYNKIKQKQEEAEKIKTRDNKRN